MNSAQDLTVFFTELISYPRDLVVVKTLGDAATGYLDLSDSAFRSLSDRAKRIPLGRLLYQSRLLEETLEVLRRGSGDRRATAELALTRLAEPRLSTSPEAMLARIEELEKILKNVEVVAEEDVTSDRINIGCTVRIQDVEEGFEEEYSIVGSTEANSLENKISNESPVGKSLIGKAVGEEAVVMTPAGEFKYKVLEIRKTNQG